MEAELLQVRVVQRCMHRSPTVAVAAETRGVLAKGDDGAAGYCCTYILGRTGRCPSYWHGLTACIVFSVCTAFVLQACSWSMHW
jgi:hypothetical protein